GGSRYVSVSAEDDCGVLRTASVTLVAKAPPSGATISAGPTALCRGSAPTAYTASVSGADSQYWELSPSAAGTISNTGTATWSSGFSGTATISFRGENECGQYDSASLMISVASPVNFYEDKDRDGFAIGNPISACENPNPTIYVSEDF